MRSPFSGTPPTSSLFGVLQGIASVGCRVDQAATGNFMAAKPIPTSSSRCARIVPTGPRGMDDLACDFALANQADLFGAMVMRCL